MYFITRLQDAFCLLMRKGYKHLVDTYHWYVLGAIYAGAGAMIVIGLLI